MLVILEQLPAVRQCAQIVQILVKTLPIATLLLKVHAAHHALPGHAQ